MFQFNIRTLLAITALAAFAVWILFVPPQWAGLLAFYILYALLPGVVLAGAFSHRGKWQVFFVGTLPWIIGIAVFDFFWIVGEMRRLGSGAWIEGFNEPDDQLIMIKMFLSVPLLLALCSGLLGTVIHRWAGEVQRHRNDRQS